MKRASPDRAPDVFRAFHVAMNDDRKQPALQMPRIVPALELDLFRELRILAWVGRIGVAAIGADQPIHHQLQRRRHLIPVHRGEDHDAMGRDPHRIDLIHPVLRLAQRMVRIAGARPVAKRAAVEKHALHGRMFRPYSETTRDRSRISSSHGCRSSIACRAICTSRQVLDISPGQVCWVRGEQLISRIRRGALASSCRLQRPRMRRGISQSSDSS